MKIRIVDNNQIDFKIDYSQYLYKFLLEMLNLKTILRKIMLIIKIFKLNELIKLEKFHHLFIIVINKFAIINAVQIKISRGLQFCRYLREKEKKVYEKVIFRPFF